MSQNWTISARWEPRCFFVRALADIDEHVEEGHVYDIIVKVRETRISNLISNTLIGLSVYLIPR